MAAAGCTTKHMMLKLGYTSEGSFYSDASRYGISLKPRDENDSDITSAIIDTLFP